MPTQITEIKYIKPTIPATPAEPSYYDVQWYRLTAGYYIDEAAAAQVPAQYKVGWRKIGDSYYIGIDDARNLLKNRILDKDYQDQLRMILDGLRK